jgi:hypothetical protein
MTLEDIYLHRLADLHQTEEQLIQSLLGLSKASISPDLREALQAKLELTSAYRERIEEVLETPRLGVAMSVASQNADNGHSLEAIGNGRSNRNLWESVLASFLQTHGVKAEDRVRSVTAATRGRQDGISRAF